MLPSKDPVVLMALHTMQESTKEAPKDKDQQWPALMAQFCMERNVLVSKCKVPPVVKNSPWFDLLPPREQQAMAVHLTMRPDTETIDLTHSINRIRPRSSRDFATILPGSRLLVKIPDGSFRVFTGCERMMLQGFHPDVVKHGLMKGNPLTDAIMRDMAGNAFCAPIPMAILMSAVLWMTDAQLVVQCALSSSSQSHDTDVDSASIADIVGDW